MPQNGVYKNRRGYKYTPWYRKRFVSAEDDEPDCDTDDSGMLAFLNDKTVQEQLNMQPTQWAPCSDDVWVKYKWGTTTIPLFSTFKAAGIKILIYSGNVDGVVPSL